MIHLPSSFFSLYDMTACTSQNNCRIIYHKRFKSTYATHDTIPHMFEERQGLAMRRAIRPLPSEGGGDQVRLASPWICLFQSQLMRQLWGMSYFPGATISYQKPPISAPYLVLLRRPRPATHNPMSATLELWGWLRACIFIDLRRGASADMLP